MHRPLLLLLALLPAACNTVGPAALAGARFDYNQEIAHSWNEQLLLNLVRLRYRDTPQFLEVGSVLAQYSLKSGMGITPVIGIDGGSNNETTLGVNVNYEERPTITLIPLQGEDFTRRLLTPIPTETLLFLSQSGWSVSRLMMLGVQRLHQLRNLPRAAGPTPDVIDLDPRFGEFIGLLRQLQVSDALDLIPIARADGTIGTRLQLTATDKPDEARLLDRVRDLLELGPEVREVDLVRDPTADAQLLIEGRSLLGAMFFLSHAVEVPAADLQSGRVTQSRTTRGEAVDWAAATGNMMKVRWSDVYPDDAFVAVQYRGKWFWIDDRDLHSKGTFFLLTNLFSLQASSASGIVPALTVSAGG